jgi:DNA-binding transcriptional regulator PaaX
VTTLRASQVETLEAVGGERYGYAGVEPSSPLAVAMRLGRSEYSTERSLIRLMELGYLSRNFRLRSVYRLTNQGRSELSERES